MSQLIINYNSEPTNKMGQFMKYNRGMLIKRIDSYKEIFNDYVEEYNSLSRINNLDDLALLHREFCKMYLSFKIDVEHIEFTLNDWIDRGIAFGICDKDIINYNFDPEYINKLMALVVNTKKVYSSLYENIFKLDAYNEKRIREIIVIQYSCIDDRGSFYVPEE